MRRTSWSCDLDGAHHYVTIGRNEVVVGHHHGSPQSDAAGVVTHAEFLAGRHQDLVRAAHGERVLAEVIASVRAVDADPAVLAVRAEIAGQRAALDAIPVVAGLLELARDPASERGRNNYGNRGGYRTWVASDHVALEVDGTAGTIGPWVGVVGARRPVRFERHVSGVVAVHDQFLVNTSDDWLLIGPDGAPRNQGRGSAPAFGTDLRVDDVVRHGETLLVCYRWFDSMDGGPGVLRLVPGVGFDGREA